MEYYEIVDDMKSPGRWLLGMFLDPNGVEIQRWAFQYGKPVDYSGRLAAKMVKAGCAMDLNFNTFNTLIASNKARTIIDELAPGAVQYFPVEVPGVQQPYFVANIIDLVDCLDEKLSHVERFTADGPVRRDRAGEISLVVDLHIDANRAAGHHLFRIKDYKTATIVSETLKTAFGEAGVTGLKYNHATSPTIADFRIKFAERQRKRAM